jgi:hypothetical protein
MMGAIEDPESALHASCVTRGIAGASVLTPAQSEGKARQAIDGAELFALRAAPAWIRDQPGAAARANHLFKVITSALLRAHGRLA